MIKNRKAKWQWFSVKLIFESTISGEPESDTIDKNYINTCKVYEESIILVKAQSFEHAYRIAEKKAKSMEIDYTNPYGESVRWKFVEAIDCFSIFEDKLFTGVELYSRRIRENMDVDSDDFMDRYYPDTIKDKSDIDYNFVLRNRDFNKRRNS